jgi:hypothetical protein
LDNVSAAGRHHGLQVCCLENTCFKSRIIYIFICSAVAVTKVTRIQRRKSVDYATLISTGNPHTVYVLFVCLFCFGLFCLFVLFCIVLLFVDIVCFIVCFVGWV